MSPLLLAAMAFLLAFGVALYAMRLYGSGDMTSQRASRLLLVSLFFLAASFLLLAGHTFETIGVL